MELIQAIVEGITPSPEYSVSKWSDEFRILPSESSSEPGQYRTDRTPYVREIADSLGVYSGVDDISVMKGTQLGLTEVGNNWLGYIIDAAPGPMLWIFPTDRLAEEHSQQKLAPTIEESPKLKAKFGKRTTKTAGNSTLRKKFPGGILFMSGANSPANYRSKSIRYLFLDDLDGFPPTVGDEGDPAELAEKRTDAFSARRKIFRVSTPTIKGISKIEKHFIASDQRFYQVPCPFCGGFQVLDWGGKNLKRGIKFKRDESGQAIAVWYECKFCHEGIDESHKPQMLLKGKWVAKFPDRRKRGYHISSLYSPIGWVSWLQIVNEFLEVKQSPERLQVWKNTRLAEVWDEAGSQPDWVILKNRAEVYSILKPPDPVCFLTAGVDVQENRLPVIVRGWGQGEQSWLVLWTELFGDPNKPDVWKALENLLLQPFVHESGTQLFIKTMAIDSGYLPQAIYNFCRSRPVLTMATKGSKIQGKPVVNRPNKVDVNWQGETIKDGCLLWTVGSDTAKAQIYSRLSAKSAGHGFYHFPFGIDDEYYLQLTAEKKVTHFRNGFPILEWVKVRERNDVLDCEVLAYAAALRAGMAHITDWDSIKPDRIKITKASTPAARPTNSKKTGKKSRW